jgi:hypothetical protein
MNAVVVSFLPLSDPLIQFISQRSPQSVLVDRVGDQTTAAAALMTGPPGGRDDAG